MSRLSLAAAVAAFAVCAAPAFAQEAAPAPTEAAAASKSAEEVAFDAKNLAFQAEAERMSTELDDVMDAADLDAATKLERTNAILARYEPTFAAFADEIAAVLRLMAEKPEFAAQKEQILAAAEADPAKIRGVPALVRTAVEQALAVPTEPAAPAGE